MFACVGRLFSDGLSCGKGRLKTFVRYSKA